MGRPPEQNRRSFMPDERIAVSAYIICLNEARRIAACIESVGFCRDIVVVDSGSTDGTLDIVRGFEARGFPVRLFERPWPGYAAQKQFALDQCREQWCLNLDADERVDATLGSEIARVTRLPGGASAWKFRLREWLPGYGYAHRCVGHKKIRRLVRRDAAHYDMTLLVHESLIVEGTVSEIREGWCLHDHRAPLELEIEKQNHYTSLKARERAATGRPARPIKMLLGPIGYFVKFYLLKRYFLCGWAGYVHAAMAAQYSFMAEAKRWRARFEETDEARPE